MDKEQTIKVFEKWLTAINADSDLEFEVKYRDRFSNHERADFISGISAGIYKHVVDTLDQRCVNQSTQSRIVKLDCKIYTNQSVFDCIDSRFESIRLTFNDGATDTPPEMMQKSKLKLPGVKNTVFSQGFKISLCKEQDIPSSSKLFEEYLEYTTTNSSNMLVRDKERLSYIIYYMDKDKHEIPIIQIDITKVHSWTTRTVNDSRDTTFELEMEYIGNRYWKYMPSFNQSSTQIDTRKLIQEINKSSFDVAKTFVNELKYLLALVQQSEILIDINSHNSVYIAYLTLIGQHDGRELYATKTNNSQRDVFIGSQPETLHTRHLATLVEDDYIVLDKSDGERMLMFIYERCIYLIDRFMHINKLDATLLVDDLNNSLLDGEWIIDNAGDRRYLVFDALFLQKKDIRTHSTLNRLKFVQQIMQAVNDTKSEFASNEQKKKILEAKFKMELKPFVRWNSGETSDVKKLLERPYPTDGRIFVPNTSCPKTRKWTGLFKWKPPHLNTIDLFPERTQTPGLYNLFIQTNLIVYNRDLYIVLKNEDKSCWIMNDSNQVISIQLSDIHSASQGELKSLHDQNIKIPFPFQCNIVTTQDLTDNCVYEFYFDNEQNTLVPLQIRYDKSTKGYQGSNHLSVAVDIWDSIKNPVTLETITNLSNDTLKREEIITKTLKSADLPNLFSELFNVKAILAKYHNKGRNTEESPLWRIKKFHSYVKNELIRKYCSRSNRIRCDTVLTSLGGKKDSKSDDCYELPNNETVISALNSILGITRKQLKFSLKNKNIIIVSQNILQHLAHSMITSTSMNNVLDIGFGKGGDLWKYAKAGVTNLIGVENESFLLSGDDDCAISRIADVKKVNDMNIGLLHQDARSNVYDVLKDKGIEMDFDTVSCFFAIHYLFRDETMITKMLQNVQEMLTYNGYFIGTMLDGESVYNNLLFSQGVFESKLTEKEYLFQLKSCYPSSSLAEMSLFGNKIDVYLNDSIIHDYDHRQPYTKQEYLVMFDKFVQLAKHFDLELVESSLFEDYYCLYDGTKLTDEDKKFSFLNRTFVFRKISNSRYHQTHVIAPLDDKNSFQYNHAIEMTKNIQSEIVKLQNLQMTTKRIKDDLDKTLLEDDAAKSTMIMGRLKTVKPLDDNLLKIDNIEQSNNNNEMLDTSAATATSAIIVDINDNEPDIDDIIENGGQDTDADSKTKRKRTEKNKDTSSEKVQKTNNDNQPQSGCGHRGKGCKECKKCKCKTDKTKCIEGVCACDASTCTNR